jgi:hypothetical protein
MWKIGRAVIRIPIQPACDPFKARPAVCRLRAQELFDGPAMNREPKLMPDLLEGDEESQGTRMAQLGWGCEGLNAS